MFDNVPFCMSCVYARGMVPVKGWNDRFPFGLNNGLPWGHFPEDLASFKEATEDSVMFMSRKTFESLPKRFQDDRQFDDRRPIYVLQGQDYDDLHRYLDASDRPERDIREWVKAKVAGFLDKYPHSHQASIIGGTWLLRTMMPYADFIHETLVYSKKNPAEPFPHSSTIQIPVGHNPHQANYYYTKPTLENDSLAAYRAVYVSARYPLGGIVEFKPDMLTKVDPTHFQRDREEGEFLAPLMDAFRKEYVRRYSHCESDFFDATIVQAIGFDKGPGSKWYTDIAPAILGAWRCTDRVQRIRDLTKLQ